MYFLGLPWEIFFGVITHNLITSIAPEKCKKECNMLLILFCYKFFVHWKIKITQFPDGLHLNLNLILFAFVKGLHVVARWLTWTLAHKKARELKKILGCLPTKPISPRQLDPWDFFQALSSTLQFFQKVQLCRQ